MSNAAENLNETASVKARPFIKWAGGKRQLLDEIITRLPAQYGRYHEPMIGGGALFFELAPLGASLSDVSEDLINTYRVIKEDVEALIVDLAKHEHTSEYFYKIRNLDREADFQKLSPVVKASRFIYLNKTCFNGLYRVNSRGQFNVPFGAYENPTLLDADNLRACSAALQSTQLTVASFESVLNTTKAGDFVYFDPPYVPLTASASFTTYTAGGFNRDLQMQLANVCRELDKNGVKFLLSNSYTEVVLGLYSGFQIEKIAANRAINSKGAQRGKVFEVLVRNY